MATCSSILAWKIPWTEEPGGATVRGVKESDTKRTLTDCQAWIYIFNIYEY